MKIQLGLLVLFLASGCITEAVHPCESAYSHNLSCGLARSCNKAEYPMIVNYLEDKCKPIPIKTAKEELMEFRAKQDLETQTILDNWCKEIMNKTGAVANRINATLMNCSYSTVTIPILINSTDTPETSNLTVLLEARRARMYNGTAIYLENATYCYAYCFYGICEIEGLCTPNQTIELKGLF